MSIKAHDLPDYGYTPEKGRWLAFVHAGPRSMWRWRHRGYVTYGRGDTEVTCEMVVPIAPGDEASPNHPLVIQYVARGWGYVGMVDHYVRGTLDLQAKQTYKPFDIDTARLKQGMAKLRADLRRPGFLLPRDSAYLRSPANTFPSYRPPETSSTEDTE